MNKVKITKTQLNILRLLHSGYDLEIAFNRAADTYYDAHIGLMRVRMPTAKLLIDRGWIQRTGRNRKDFTGTYGLSDTGRAVVQAADTAGKED